VTRRFRTVAPWFADVRDYEWQLLASGVSEDLAYADPKPPEPRD
jgi:hypothetical protein